MRSFEVGHANANAPQRTLHKHYGPSNRFHFYYSNCQALFLCSQFHHFDVHNDSRSTSDTTHLSNGVSCNLDVYNFHFFSKYCRKQCSKY